MQAMNRKLAFGLIRPINFRATAAIRLLNSATPSNGQGVSRESTDQPEKEPKANKVTSHAENTDIDINGRIYTQAELKRVVTKVASQNRGTSARRSRKPTAAPPRSAARLKLAGISLDELDAEVEAKAGSESGPERGSRDRQPRPRRTGDDSKTPRAATRLSSRGSSPASLRGGPPAARGQSPSRRGPPRSAEVNLVKPTSIFEAVPGYSATWPVNNHTLRSLNLRSPISNVLPQSYSQKGERHLANSMQDTVWTLLSKNATLSDRKRHNILESVKDLTR